MCWALLVSLGFCLLQGCIICLFHVAIVDDVTVTVNAFPEVLAVFGVYPLVAAVVDILAVFFLLISIGPGVVVFVVVVRPATITF